MFLKKIICDILVTWEENRLSNIPCTFLENIEGWSVWLAATTFGFEIVRYWNNSEIVWGCKSMNLFTMHV